MELAEAFTLGVIVVSAVVVGCALVNLLWYIFTAEVYPSLPRSAQIMLRGWVKGLPQAALAAVMVIGWRLMTSDSELLSAGARVIADASPPTGAPHWYSSNPSRVSVHSSTGEITRIYPGEATICGPTSCKMYLD